MIATKEQQKEKALELLKNLGVNEQYIECVREDPEFVKNFFSWHRGNSEIKSRIEQLEKTKGMYIYYVTHELCAWGECYSFLCVSKFLEDFPLTSVRSSKCGNKVVHAWVENISRPECSEYGYIGVRNKDDGSLIRVM